MNSAEKTRSEFEKILLNMTNVLPYSAVEIKSRPYKEFFGLINRTQEIINEREKNK